MRQLVPEALVEVDLRERYATDWIDPGGVRVNFVSSVDGAISVAGRSEGLQTAGDNRVFAALRDLADVVLVGAGTARTEGYEAIHLGDRRRGVRAQYGLTPGLTTAVVSARLDLDPKSKLFTAAADDARTIVITGHAAPADRKQALAEVADVIECGTDPLDLAAARTALAERGLRRVLCEGGPTLFADLVDLGVADELCLSVSPSLVGPGSPGILAGQPWPRRPVPLWLTMLLEEDGALFARYRLH